MSWASPGFIAGRGGVAVRSGVMSFAVQPQVFFICDGCVCMSMEMSNISLGTGDGGTEEEVSGGESQVLLVVVREGEAERCGCTMGGKLQVVN